MGETFVSFPENFWRVAAALLAAALFAAHAIGASSQASATPTEIRAKDDISGDWQGTLTLRNKERQRIVLRITRAGKGFAAKWFSIDETLQPAIVSSISVEGSKVKLAVDMIGGAYDGSLDVGGGSMVGTWTHSSNPLPLTFIRATRETAWEIPTPPSPMKSMPGDAEPTFDVATIKPNNSGTANLKMYRFGEDDFETRNSSLVDLIERAYGVQANQITGGPEWMGHDRYDILAKPDIAGVPNDAQVRSMVRKLLADRFNLTFHKDKKELPAYVLTLVKVRSQLNPTDFNGPGMSFGFVPKAAGVTMLMRNGSMSDFSEALQPMVLDKPVVNDTGLTGKYDLAVTFIPDDSQFNGHPPMRNGRAPNPDAADAAPSLFDAIQKQLGLRLEGKKTAVDLIVIDHVEKPSPN